MFVAWENIVCTLKLPSLIAKIGKMKKSLFGRIDYRTKFIPAMTKISAHDRLGQSLNIIKQRSFAVLYYNLQQNKILNVGTVLKTVFVVNF